MSKYVKKNAYVYHKDKLEGQTVIYWAKHYNVSKQRIYQRLEQWGTVHHSERPPGRPKKIIIEHTKA
jgi:Zn-dependent peptidase ImmA (M78 family)